jgi:hypothetical protein
MRAALLEYLRRQRERDTNYNNQKPPPVYMRRPISISTARARNRAAQPHGALPTCSGAAAAAMVSVSAGPATGPLCGPGPCTNTRKTHARASRERRTGWKSWSSQALASETVRCGWKISPEAELSRLSESGQQHTRTPRTIHSHTKSKSAARRGAGAQPAHTHTRELQVYMLTK